MVQLILLSAVLVFHLTRQGGPFVGVIKSKKLDLLIGEAMLLFAEGPPMRGSKWIYHRHLPPDMYTKWFEKVPNRTVPTPISSMSVNKGYSVDLMLSFTPDAYNMYAQ